MDFNFDQWMLYAQLNPGELDRRQKRMSQDYHVQAAASMRTTHHPMHEQPVDPKMVAVIDLLASRIETLDSILKYTLPTIMQPSK